MTEDVSHRQTGRTHKLLCQLLEDIVGNADKKGTKRGFFVCHNHYMLDYVQRMVEDIVTHNGVVKNIESITYPSTGGRRIKFLNDHELTLITAGDRALKVDRRNGLVFITGAPWPVVLDHNVTWAQIEG